MIIVIYMYLFDKKKLRTILEKSCYLGDRYYKMSIIFGFSW